MNPLKDRQEYIDRYRSGEISETDFKQRLESDSELKQEFDLHQKDLQVIRSTAKQELKKKALAALENHEKKPTPIFSLKKAIQIAAIFAFAIAAFFLLQNGQVQSGNELFASHFELPDPAGERNANTQTEIWNEAMTAYSNQDFKKTIELLSPLVNQPNFPFTDRGNLYLGLSQLMQDKNQKAVNYFEAINAESSFIQDAEWFLALTFLKMENLIEAKRTLQKIADQPRHFKYKEAVETLEQINK